MKSRDARYISISILLLLLAGIKQRLTIASSRGTEGGKGRLTTRGKEVCCGIGETCMCSYLGPKRGPKVKKIDNFTKPASHFFTNSHIYSGAVRSSKLFTLLNFVVARLTYP